jgi:hypothetical protein
MIALGATVEAMVQDRSEPDSADSAKTAGDDPLAGLRRLAGLAKDLGLTDVSSFTDMLDSARNEGRGAEFFKSLRTLLVDQMGGSGDAKSSLSDLGERLASWAASSTSGSSTSATSTPRASSARGSTPGGAPSGPPLSGTWVSSGRETRTEAAGSDVVRTETALLRRIEELSGAATVEELVQLATAYAELCSVHGGGSRPGA